MTLRVLVFFVAVAVASAGTIAFAPSDGAWAYPNYSAVVGTYFSVTSPITVKALGEFHAGGDPWPVAPDVRLYSAPSPLYANWDVDVNAWIARAVLAPDSLNPAETVGSTNGSFEFFDIDPVMLQPGDYMILGFGPSDAFAITEGGVLNQGPAIVFDGEALLPTAQFSIPQIGSPEWSVFGPNFIYDSATAPAPEPGSIILIGAGLALTVLGKRIKR